MGLPLFSSLFHPHPDHLFLSLIASSGASSGRWPEWQDFRVSPRDLLFKNREQAALFFTLKREDLNLLRQCFDGRAQLGHLATACGPEVGFEFADTLLQARDRSRPEPRFRRTKFRENGGGPVGRCAADTGRARKIGDGEAPVAIL